MSHYQLGSLIQKPIGFEREERMVNRLQEELKEEKDRNQLLHERNEQLHSQLIDLKSNEDQLYLQVTNEIDGLCEQLNRLKMKLTELKETKYVDEKATQTEKELNSIRILPTPISSNAATSAPQLFSPAIASTVPK